MFDTFTGIFQGPIQPARIAVLMLSPFGYEELCSRASWAALADRLAEAGMASLRFDYPGTGNALDVDQGGLDDWREAAREAGEALRRRSGLSEIVVLGQGLGGTLALSWVETLGPLNGLILLEPAASGRAYLRGLTAWGRSIMQASGLTVDANERHAVAGFSFPESRVSATQALDLKRLTPSGMPPILLLERQGGPVGRIFDGATWAAGNTVTRRGFPEYSDLVTDPTSAVVPNEAIAAICAWISALSAPAASDPIVRDAAPQPLVGPGFEEQPIRFGADRRLAGVLCRPRSPTPGSEAVVITGAGRDHSIGWGRSAVAQARALARRGVASLRFDAGGIGDSRPAPDAPEEILYSPHLCDDLRAAVDHLDSLGYSAISLFGRCSGAWAAFTVAVEDGRIRSIALVNLPYFLWDSSKSLAAVMRFSQRRVGDFRATLMSRKGLTRLLKGELDLRGAFRFLVRQGNLRVLRPCAPYLGPLTVESRRFHRLHDLFGRLQARNVPMLLAYAEGDASLGELRSFMGPDLARLKRYGNVRVVEVPDADHNFSPEPARARLREVLTAFFAERDRTGTSVSAIHTDQRKRVGGCKSDCILAEQL